MQGDIEDRVGEVARIRRRRAARGSGETVGQAGHLPGPMAPDDEREAEGTDDGPEQDERDVGEGRQSQRQRVVGPPVAVGRRSRQGAEPPAGRCAANRTLRCGAGRPR